MHKKKYTQQIKLPYAITFCALFAYVSCVATKAASETATVDNPLFPTTIKKIDKEDITSAPITSDKTTSLITVIIPQPPTTSEIKVNAPQGEISANSYSNNSDIQERKQIYFNGECHQIIETKNTKLSCYMKTLKYQHKYYVLAKITVKNKSKEPITVFPAQFCLEDSGNALGSVKPIDIDYECAKTTRHTMIWSALSGGRYVPGQGYYAPVRSYSSTYGNISGNGGFANYNGNTYTSYYRGGGFSGAIAGSLASKAETLRALQPQILRTNTVAPGDNLKGILIFPTTKKAPQSHIAATIENETFYF